MMSRDRRALIVGGATVLLAAVMLRIVPWTVRAVGTLRTHAKDSAAAALRAQRVIDESPVVRDSLAAALGAVVALAPRLVEGRTAAEAGASLTGLVALAANQSALRVVRLDPGPDSTGGIFARIAVRAELEGDVRGLGRFLHAMETGAPLLTVPRFAVTAPEPASATSTPERLRIEATVTGLYWPKGNP